MSHIQLIFVQLNGLQWSFANETKPPYKRMFESSGWANINFKPTNSYHVLLTTSKPAISKTGESFDVVESLFTPGTLDELKNLSYAYFHKVKNLEKHDFSLYEKETFEFAKYLKSYSRLHNKQEAFNTSLYDIIYPTIEVKLPGSSTLLTF